MTGEDDKLSAEWRWWDGPTVSVPVTAILDRDNAADPVSDNESRLNDLKPPKCKKIIYFSALSRLDWVQIRSS